jgi:hypothetical protein
MLFCVFPRIPARHAVVPNSRVFGTPPYLSVEVILLRWEATLSKTERKSQGQLGDEHRRKRRTLARFQQSYVALRTFEQGNPSLTKFIELADAKLEDYLQRLDQSDASESKTGGSRVKNLAEKIAAIRERRTRCKDMLAQLDKNGEDQISLTDPDSRAMAAHTRVAVGYNVQVAVDAKHKLIVEQQVTNQVVDMGEAGQRFRQA